MLCIYHDDAPGAAAACSRSAAAQLTVAHGEHKKLRDQYGAEVLAHNGDLAALEAAERRAAELQAQLATAQVQQSVCTVFVALSLMSASVLSPLFYKKHT